VSAVDPQHNPKNLTPKDPLELRVLKTRRIFLIVWTVIGSLVLLVALGYVLGQLRTALAVIIMAALVVFILKSPVDWLERHRIPRWLGALIAYLCALAIMVVLGLIVIPFITRQLIGLISLVPDYVTRATNFFQTLYNNYSYILQNSNINQIVTSAFNTISAWAVSFVASAPSGAINFGTGLITALLVFVISVIAGFWILKDLPTIKRELKTIIGPRYGDDLSFIAEACSRAIGGYLRGMLVAGTCVGLVTGTGFALLGLPFPALLGLLAGLMVFIPIFGAWVSGTTVALIGLFISPLTAVLAVLILIVAVQLTDNLVTPRVMLTTVELHPAMVLVGVFAGGVLAGLPGLLAAIPLLAAAKSIFVYYFEKRSGRQLSSAEGALFKGRATAQPRFTFARWFGLSQTTDAPVAAVQTSMEAPEPVVPVDQTASQTAGPGSAAPPGTTSAAAAGGAPAAAGVAPESASAPEPTSEAPNQP